MTKHLSHSEIDKQRWDECIAGVADGMLYGYSWYLDLVCPGWEALVNKDYSIVMPLTARKKYGFNYLYQPHFTQQLGVFSSNNNAENVQEFIHAIPAKFSFIEINLNQRNSFQGSGFTVTKNSNFELVLGKSYQEIAKSYSDNTKRNIRKALDNGFEIKAANDETENIIRLFREDVGRKLPHLGDYYYELLLEIIAVCNKNAAVEIYGAYADGALCAGAFFIASANRSVFLFSGNSVKGKSTGAMHFLVDRFIHDHSGSGLTLDFEGSNNPNLARFYKGFGSKESVYLRLRKNKLPWYIRWIKH